MLWEWCGARNGRRLVSAPPSISPATDAIIETSSSSAGVSGGRMVGSRAANIAGAGRSHHEQIVATGGGDLERALGALLALDVLEIGERAIDFADLRLRTGEHLRAAEMIGEL